MKRSFIKLCFLFLLACRLSADDAVISARKTIVIDPGHATISYTNQIVNPGKLNNSGMWESDIVIKISKKLGKLLEEKGYAVFYTRTEEDFWRQSYSTIEDNTSRAIFANEIQADALLSIHCDWHPSSKVSGITTFYEKKNAYALGDLIHKNLLKKTKAKNRKFVNDSFTILDKAEMPALLIEVGFLSHRDESKKLSRPAYQDVIAQSIADGIFAYFN